MSDPNKTRSRKPGADESTTPPVTVAETSSGDIATSDASAPAAVAEPEPAPAPEPAAVSARPAESPPQSTAQVIDLDGVRAEERRATLAYVAEVHELCALAGRGALAAEFVAKVTPVAQVRRALLEARAAEDEATAIRGQVRMPTVEPAQPAIDTAAIYAARNQNVR
jgi:hypothetical protein